MSNASTVSTARIEAARRRLAELAAMANDAQVQGVLPPADWEREHTQLQNELARLLAELEPT